MKMLFKPALAIAAITLTLAACDKIPNEVAGLNNPMPSAMPTMQPSASPTTAPTAAPTAMPGHHAE